MIAGEATSTARAYRALTVIGTLGLLGCIAPAAALTPPPLSTISEPGSPLDPPDAIPSTPTPSSLALRQLIAPGCCGQFFWLADGKTIVFEARPGSANYGEGLYALRIDQAEPYLFSTQMGLPDATGRYLSFLDAHNQTVIHQLDTDRQIAIHNEGRRVYISPHGNLAWLETGRVGEGTVITAEPDGSQVRPITTVQGGGIVGWLDDFTILLIGSDQSELPNSLLLKYDREQAVTVELARLERIGGVAIAPGGHWILYTEAPDTPDRFQAGVHLVSADGTQRYDLKAIGSARWRDAARLLILPDEPRSGSSHFWQFDTISGQSTLLTDGRVADFLIDGAAWRISPDGSAVAFTDTNQRALWLLTLPISP